MEPRFCKASQAWPAEKFSKWKMDGSCLPCICMLPTGKKQKEEWRLTIFIYEYLRKSFSVQVYQVSYIRSIFHKFYCNLYWPGKPWNCIRMGNAAALWLAPVTLASFLPWGKGSAVQIRWQRKAIFLKQQTREYSFQSSKTSTGCIWALQEIVTAKTVSCIQNCHLSMANYCVGVLKSISSSDQCAPEVLSP